MWSIEIVNYDNEAENYYFRNKFFLCPEALYNIQKNPTWFLCEAQEYGEFTSSVCMQSFNMDRHKRSTKKLLWAEKRIKLCYGNVAGKLATLAKINLLNNNR